MIKLIVREYFQSSFDGAIIEQCIQYYIKIRADVKHVCALHSSLASCRQTLACIINIYLFRDISKSDFTVARTHIYALQAFIPF